MALSPMIQQYLEIKEKYEGTIIFFRLGDFYEMFFEQAELCSRELELTLTGKDCGLDKRAPMCGIPYHSAEPYIQKLVEKGYKVAICEQIEDAKLAKGLVKRDVIKIITPGTIVESNMLDETINNFIATIFNIGREYGLSYVDVSTGEMFITYVGNNDIDKIIDEIKKISPKELVLDDKILSNSYISEKLIKKSNIYISRYNNIDESFFESKNFNLPELSEIEKMSMVLLLNYIEYTQKSLVNQINKVAKYNIEKYMRLDISTRRNLETVESNTKKTKKGSLLWVVDRTSTAMGARKLRHFIENPLVSKKDIEERLNSVAILKEEIFAREEIKGFLKSIYDIERLISKVSNNIATPRDIIALKNSFKILPNLKEVLAKCINESVKKNKYSTNMLKRIFDDIDELKDVYELIDKSINDDPPISIKEGGIIKDGYNSEIDGYKAASTKGKRWILELEKKEKELTNIKGLKVNYNKIFGYYIEITKMNFKDIPKERYIRKQTLVDKERFITEELKELEEKILGSEEKLVNLEYESFINIRQNISTKLLRIQRTAQMIALIDVYISLAIVAEESNYTLPIISDNGVIEIKEGRHPVVEKMMPEITFIPNDTYMDNDNERFHIITGPNMSGKSTYMRQIATIVYLAHIGSFVPAASAKIPIVDRIFTRVGASDDLASGESTFMVEMTELSNILKNATSKSLIILDEIGRGTSTYDGMAIAWSTVEYIATKNRAKTLFATHYHELKELETLVSGVKNYSVAVKEKGDEVIFLRKIINEPTDESYGIYVAALAGIPKVVVDRSKEILLNIECKTKDLKLSKIHKPSPQNVQVDMFNYKLTEIGRLLDNTNVDELSPKEALDVLYKLKDKIK